MQDEHNCMAVALSELVRIAQRGGIKVTVNGMDMLAKVWIHYVDGDISGNNRVFGHFNTSSRGLKRRYRDCMCRELSDSNPQCVCFTIKRYNKAIKK